MPSYAMQQDLYDRFGQAEIDALADRDGDGAPDPGVIDGVLADASAEMDGYFRATRLETPLADPPIVCTRICANLARYQLYTNGAPEQVKTLHDDAIAWLKNVAAGRVSLGTAADGSEAAAENDVVEIHSGGNVFGRDPDGRPTW